MAIADEEFKEDPEFLEYPHATAFIRYKTPKARARLHFKTLRKEYPEIANAVDVTRSRVTELQERLRLDAEVAEGKFRSSTVNSIIATVCAALIGLLATAFTDSAFAAALVVAVGILVALFPASAQAYGWHNRYKAMFSAAWKLKGLRSRIDQELI